MESVLSFRCISKGSFHQVCLIFCKDGCPASSLEGVGTSTSSTKEYRCCSVEAPEVSAVSEGRIPSTFLATRGFAFLEFVAGTPALDFVGLASWLEVVRSLPVDFLLDISVILMETVLMAMIGVAN